MRVSLGAITPEAWTRKMPIDHDLEVVRPWHYSTYLIDDGIRVSFSPARKAAIYKIDFPRGEAGNLLFSGTSSTHRRPPRRLRHRGEGQLQDQGDQAGHPHHVGLLLRRDCRPAGQTGSRDPD